MIFRVSILFWALAVIAILIAAKLWQPAQDFRDRMLRQWKLSLAIALLYILSVVNSGIGVFPFYSIAIFCQAMIGFALAYSIVGYEPLPVIQAVTRKKNQAEQIYLMLGWATAILLIAVVVNSFFWSMLIQIFGETPSNFQGLASLFPQNAGQSFLLMLAGAGIFEETLCRLVLLSLFWRLTHRPKVAIILSALLFGVYHLSPLDAAYLQYWERPITTMILSTVMGVVMGYIYHKNGYETVVLGHTLGNWVPLILSRAA
jgi:membrane protease YdiL (CAAX protease family)